MAFQSELIDRFSPSMQQRIDLDTIYQRCVRQVSLLAHDDQPPRPWSQKCPFGLNDLLAGQPTDLEAMLA